MSRSSRGGFANYDVRLSLESYRFLDEEELGPAEEAPEEESQVDQLAAPRAAEPRSIMPVARDDVIVVIDKEATKRVKGMDPPPGFGLDGVPTGAALFAGLAAWLLFSVSSLIGFRGNHVLGRTTTLACTYLVAVVCIGVFGSFALHLGVGIAFCGVLLFDLGWAAQIWVTTNRKWLTLRAYLAPLLIGTAFGVPVEHIPGRFGMPPASGYAIGCAITFVATVLLSHAFETRGIAGAQLLTLLLLEQDAIALVGWSAGYFLVWTSGVVVAGVLELLTLATISIGRLEGNQFGAWQAGYPLFIVGLFSPLLVSAYSQTWPVAVTIGASTCLAFTGIIYLRFRRKGVLGGMHAIFISFLCFLQANLMLVEFIVARMPAPLAIGFGSAAFILLLFALLIGLRVDDGSGRLYGSGVEVLLFVVTAQLICYGSGLIMYGWLGATDTNAHLAAGVLGVLVLLCPSLTQAMASNHEAGQARKNFRIGLRLALFYALLWLTTVLVLRYVCYVSMDIAVQVCSGFVVTFVLVLACAIHRFLATILLIFFLYFASAIGGVMLVYIWNAPVPPVVAISVLSFLGFGLPMPVLWPLAQQRANARENSALDRIAASIQNADKEAAATRAARPVKPRAKHLAKARRLEHKQNLPKLLDLSHNGVMERAGTLRWCKSASDGRPILPFVPQLLVARGSFLYLFEAEGELLPTTRAVDAIPIFGAHIMCIPEYYDDRMLATNLKHLLDVRLNIAWKGKLRFYMQLRSEPQMRAWHSDLQKRAREDSSASHFRAQIYQQATQPDPSLAEGMLLVRKAMMRASTESERRAVSRGITCHEADAAAARMAAASAGDGGGFGPGADTAQRRHSSARDIGRAVARKSGKAVEKHVRTRIGKAVHRAQAAEQTQELVSTKVFDSVVMYTPRGLHGSADDLRSHYPVEKVRYPSLAASAREATQLNEQLDEIARRERNDWLAGRTTRKVEQ